jgi:hypothetical protein
MSDYRSYPSPPRYSKSEPRRAWAGELASSAWERALLTVAGGVAAAVLGIVVMLVMSLILWPLGVSLGYTATMVWLVLCAGFGAGVALCEGRDAWNYWSS